jgi:MSHA biogenesis protein MshM
LINDFLLNAANKGKKIILIIDEAQAMPLETLETLRLLTNLETEKQKLLQIVLFGQDELDQLLQQKSIRQLRQRITFSYTLKPLNKNQVKEYVLHRLRVAGNTHTDLLSNLSILALHRYSNGIPRLLNILAHKAMLAAYGKGLSRVGWYQVWLAAQDTDSTRKPSAVRNLGSLFIWLTLLCCSLYLFLFFYLELPL